MDKTRRDEQDAWEHAEDVKRKIHRLSLSRRFYLRAAEIKLKRNRATIAAARLRNRQLKSALNDLREKERCALGVNDLARVQKRVAALEKYHNHLLHMSKVQHKLVDTLARTVAKKHHEFDELIFMYHDACRTREAARGQLQQVLKENFEIGVRYHHLFRQPAKSSNKRTIAELEDAIANLTTKFRLKSMKELYMALIEEQRKNFYMQYFKHELQEMVDNLKHGSTSAKSYHEKVIKLKRRVCKPVDTRSKVIDIANEDKKDKNDEAVPKSKKSSSLGKEVGMKHKLCKMIRGMQKLLEKIQEGRLYNSENEHLKRILVQLEQKLVQMLQGLQSWMEGMRAEKAKEHYARLHRTSIMIKENYDKGHGASHEDDNLSTARTHGQD